MSTTDRSRRLLGSTPLILVAMFAAGAALLALLYWGLHLSKSIGMHYSTTVSAAALSSGTSAQKKHNHGQRPTPSSRNPAVDTSTTATWPQQ